MAANICTGAEQFGAILQAAVISGPAPRLLPLTW